MAGQVGIAGAVGDGGAALALGGGAGVQLEVERALQVAGDGVELGACGDGLIREAA